MGKKIVLFDILTISFLVLGTIAFVVIGDHETLYFINHRHNELLDYIHVGFSAFGRGDILIVLGILLLLKPEYRNAKFFLTLLGLLIVTASVAISLKWLFNTPRPLVTIGLNKLHIVSWMDQAYHKGLPSGHTMGAFSFFTFFTHLCLRKTWSQLFVFILAVGCGISRIYLAQHFLSDVLLGCLIGWIIGYGMFRLYLSRK